MDILTAIESRHSVRAFTKEPVSVELLGEILKVARRAPSGTNTQPGRVYVVTGEARDHLCESVLAKREHEPERERNGMPFGEYMYYSNPMTEPYLTRRRTVGWDLYRTLGVQKGDRQESWRLAGRNYQFFDAPAGFIFTLDKALEQGSWIDLGIFMQSIMLAARAYGLHTCAQGAWAMYFDVVRDCLSIPASETVVCGMSIGHRDPDAAANTLRTDRAPVEEIARFVDKVPAGAAASAGGILR